MSIVFHGVNFKVSNSLKAHVNDKLNKPLGYFSKISKTDVYFKKEKNDYVVEIVILADEEKFYFSHRGDDVYTIINHLSKRVSENVKKFKKKISHHSAQKFIHHNQHMVITKNIKSHKDMNDHLDVFSHKPILPADAYFEVSNSKLGLLIFRNIKDFQWYIMKKEKNHVFLISKHKPKFLFFKLHGSKMDFLQSEVLFENNKIKIFNKQKLPLSLLSKEDAMKAMSKKNFLLYFDKDSKDLNILFRYKKSKIALVEHVEVYK